MLESSLASLCARHGLTVVSKAEGAAGGSRFVAHVRDEQGRSLLLKQTTPDRHRGEIAALHAWRGRGVSVQLIAELDHGAYLAEWLDGTSVADVALDTPVDFEAIGQMMRRLHSSPVPPSHIAPVRAFFAPGFSGEWHELSSGTLQFFAGIAEQLHSYAPRNPTLLHGDAVPANVILTSDGPRVIDPIGRAGLPAWDIAQFSAAALGRGRRRVVAQLLAGYGTAPPLFAEMLAWMLLFFLRSNLAAGREQFATNLRPIALELVASGHPERFLHSSSVI